VNEHEVLKRTRATRMLLPSPHGTHGCFAVKKMKKRSPF
jgi:hypothetical protein